MLIFILTVLLCTNVVRNSGYKSWDVEGDVVMQSGEPKQLEIQENANNNNTTGKTGHPKCHAYFWVYFWNSRPHNQTCNNWKNTAGKWNLGQWYCFTRDIDQIDTRILFGEIEIAALNKNIYDATSPLAQLWVGGTVGAPFDNGQEWTRTSLCGGQSQLGKGQDTIGCCMNKLRLDRKNTLPHLLYYKTPDECASTDVLNSAMNPRQGILLQTLSKPVVGTELDGGKPVVGAELGSGKPVIGTEAGGNPVVGAELDGGKPVVGAELVGPGPDIDHSVKNGIYYVVAIFTSWSVVIFIVTKRKNNRKLCCSNLNECSDYDFKA